MELGAKMMYLRKMKKLTQAQLGELLGVSYMTIRRWEADKSTPRVDGLRELAKIFDTSVEYFAGQSDNVSEGQNSINTSPSMAYWGGVLDNAQKAVRDGQNLKLIYSLLADATNTVKIAMV